MGGNQSTPDQPTPDQPTPEFYKKTIKVLEDEGGIEFNKELTILDIISLFNKIAKDEKYAALSRMESPNGPLFNLKETEETIRISKKADDKLKLFEGIGKNSFGKNSFGKNSFGKKSKKTKRRRKFSKLKGQKGSKRPKKRGAKSKVKGPRKAKKSFIDTLY